MSDYQQGFIGDKRNAPIWQVFAIVIVLMGLAGGSFYMGSQHPAPESSYDYSSSSDYGTDTSSDYGTDGSDYSSDGGGLGIVDQTQYLTLSNLIGYGSSSVEQALRASGLNVQTQYTTGDPSLAARLNNGCPVVDQSPYAGSTVAVGSTVIILADCPLTGNW